MTDIFPTAVLTVLVHRHLTLTFRPPTITPEEIAAAYQMGMEEINEANPDTSWFGLATMMGLQDAKKYNYAIANGYTQQQANVYFDQLVYKGAMFVGTSLLFEVGGEFAEPLLGAGVDYVGDCFADGCFAVRGEPLVADLAADGLMAREGSFAFRSVASTMDEDIVGSSFLNAGDAGIDLSASSIDVAPAQWRAMVSEGRNNLLLSEADINQVTAYASQLGVPSENLWIRNFERLEGGGPGTAYGSDFDLLNVGLNVKPAPVLGNAFSQISIPGALAHEIVGRRGAELAGMGFSRSTPLGVALDEAQAHYRAAMFAPSLTEGETRCSDASRVGRTDAVQPPTQ